MTESEMLQATEAACKLVASGEMAYFEAITSQFAPLCEQPQPKEPHEEQQPSSDGIAHCIRNDVASSSADQHPPQASEGASAPPLSGGSGEVAAAEPQVIRKVLWLVISESPNSDGFHSLHGHAEEYPANDLAIPIHLVSRDGGKTLKLDDSAKDAEIARLRASAVQECKAWKDAILASEMENLREENKRLIAERDTTKAAAGFCEKHQPTGGHRNCLVCGCQALSRTISKIDYAISPKNDMEVSLFDVDCNEERVIRAVELMRDERDAAVKRAEDYGAVWTTLSEIVEPIRKCFRDRTMPFAEFQRIALEWDRKLTGENHPDTLRANLAEAVKRAEILAADIEGKGGWRELCRGHEQHIGTLEARLNEAEKAARAAEVSLEKLCIERDIAEEFADQLANAIAGGDEGEHSNQNNPWRTALELAKGPPLLARLAAAEKVVEAAQKVVGTFESTWSAFETERSVPQFSEALATYNAAKEAK